MRTVASLWFIVLSFLLFTSGCDPMFCPAPTEMLRQNAQLCVDASRIIRDEGSDPGSPAATIAHQAAVNTQTYFGLPREPMTTPSAIIQTAQADAQKTPADAVFETTEQGLSLAAELALLFGVGGTGVAGKKLMDWIQIARNKNKALQEIVKKNELFKDRLAKEDPAKLEIFKECHSDQSLSTKCLVTELKA